MAASFMQNDSVRNFGRIVFWLGAGFTTLAAPWMLGGQPLAAQQWLLGSAALTLVGGLLVRLAAVPTLGSQAAWRVQRAALLFGLLFVGYLFLQARNPSFRVVLSGNLWVVTSIQGVAPGPHSIMAPFDYIPGDWLPYKNAWRYLLIYGTGWLFAAGLALGLTERNDALRWYRLVAGNAALLALVCIVHRLSSATLTLWQYGDTFDFTRSPVFFYKNHNGAYLAASVAVVLGVALAEKPGRARLLWEIVALATWVATVVVNSRVATACATAWVVLYLAKRFSQARAERRLVFDKKAVAIGFGLVASLLGLLALAGGGKAVSRFAPLLSSPGDFMQGGRFRELIRDVGVEIWQDDAVWGWGGGSYMYLFNTYHHKVPEVARWMYGEQPNLNRLVSPVVNCDWIEFLVEYGLIGSGFLLAALLVVGLACWRWRHSISVEALFLLAGAAGILLHAYFDYVLRNPAIMLLLLGMLMVAVRLSVPGRSAIRIEQKPRPRKDLNCSNESV